jgi:hypothetical protein
MLRRHLIHPGLLQREPGVRYVQLRRETLAKAQLGQLVNPLGLAHRLLRGRNLQPRPFQLAVGLLVLQPHPLSQLRGAQLRLPHLRLRRIQLRTPAETLEQRPRHREAHVPVVTPVLRHEPGRIRLALEVPGQRQLRQERRAGKVSLLLPHPDPLFRRAHRRAASEQTRGIGQTRQLYGCGRWQLGAGGRE